METFSSNPGAILLYCVTLFAVFLRIWVEVRKIFRRYRAAQRDARAAKDELADIPAYDENRSRERRAELLCTGWRELEPGIFVKSVGRRPVRTST